MTELGDEPTDEEIQDMILLVDENGDNNFPEQKIGKPTRNVMDH